MQYVCFYNSPLGKITMTSDGKALTSLTFDGQKLAKATARLLQAPSIQLALRAQQAIAAEANFAPHEDNTPTNVADSTAAENNPTAKKIFEQTALWLDCYFAGNKPTFTPPLMPDGTPFRQSVWQLLLAIPYGSTTTYGALANALRTQGKHASAQAVGGAVGSNPIALIVPCHRVLGANGCLTGYAGGTDKKAALLHIEHIAYRK